MICTFLNRNKWINNAGENTDRIFSSVSKSKKNPKRQTIWNAIGDMRRKFVQRRHGKTWVGCKSISPARARAGSSGRAADVRRRTQKGKKAEKREKTPSYKEGHSVRGVSKKRARHSFFIVLRQPWRWCWSACICVREGWIDGGKIINKRTAEWKADRSGDTMSPGCLRVCCLRLFARLHRKNIHTYANM